MSSDHGQVDLLIIGGGVLGAFHAYHALQRGLTVALVERSATPQGATVRNFGQVVPSGLDQQWQRYGRRSLEIYQEIQCQFDISVRQLGSIYIASDDEELTLIEELSVINQQENFNSELWNSERCRARYPQLRAEYCRGGLFFPEELSVNPRQLIHRMHQFLSQHANCTVAFQTGICQLESTNNGVSATATNGRQFKAEQAIICCGTEFQLLFPERFTNSNLTAVKLQMLRLKPQQQVSIPGNVLTGLSVRRYESFSQCPSWSAIKAREPSDTFGKQWGVHILFKQETDGGIILGDSHEYAPLVDSDRLGFELRQDVNDYMINEGKQIFNLHHWEVETAWCGRYCQTEDPAGLFLDVIDDRIHIVTGIGGKGMTSSPGFAEQYLSRLFH